MTDQQEREIRKKLLLEYQELHGRISLAEREVHDAADGLWQVIKHITEPPHALSAKDEELLSRAPEIPPMVRDWSKMLARMEQLRTALGGEPRK